MSTNAHNLWKRSCQVTPGRFMHRIIKVWVQKNLLSMLIIHLVYEFFSVDSVKPWTQEHNERI